MVLPSSAASVCYDSSPSPVLWYSWHWLAKYCFISVFWLLPPPLFFYTADIVLQSPVASVCSDSSLLPCVCIQLTLSCQVLPHQCIRTPPWSPVLVYSWHCLAKYCRTSVFWRLPPPMFLCTADNVLRSTAASVRSDSSLLPCSCIQLTLSCQVQPHQCVLTPPSYPVLVYSWHCLDNYHRISVFWLLPPSLFLYTADIVFTSTVASVCPETSFLPCFCITLTLPCKVLPHQCVQAPPASPIRVNYTADITLPSNAASVSSDYSLLPCSCIQLIMSYQVLSHQCFLPPASSHVLVYSWYCLAKYCRIPNLSFYRVVIVLPSTAAWVCSNSSLLPCSCLQLTLSCKVLPQQCVLNPPSSTVRVYSWHCFAKYCRISVLWLLLPRLFLYTADII